MDSGTVLCCYGNSVGSPVGGGRQPLCGNQHWRQQLCPFPEAVEAFLSDGEPFPLPSPEAAGGPREFRAVTPGSQHLSHREELGSSRRQSSLGTPPSVCLHRPHVLLEISSSFSWLICPSVFVHSLNKYIFCAYPARGRGQNSEQDRAPALREFTVLWGEYSDK